MKKCRTQPNTGVRMPPSNDDLPSKPLAVYCRLAGIQTLGAERNDSIHSVQRPGDQATRKTARQKLRGWSVEE